MMPKLLAALDFRSNNGTHRPARRPRRDPARGGRGAAVLPGRRDRHRGRDPAEVARHRGRGCAWRRAEGEPDQLRDLRAADAPRAVALQGGAGGGRGPLPQPDEPAGRLRRAPGRLLRAARPAHRGGGVHGRAPGRDGRGAAPARPRMPRNHGCASTRAGGIRSWSACSSRSPSRRARRAQGRARPALADDGLLDILKEADLRIGFTDAFTTAAAREATDRDEVRAGCCCASTASAPTPG